MESVLWFIAGSPEQQALARAAAASGMPYPLPPGFPAAPGGLNIPTSATGEMPAQMMAALAAAHPGAGQDMTRRDLMMMQQVGVKVIRTFS